jgi:hypothetical protein
LRSGLGERDKRQKSADHESKKDSHTEVFSFH